MLQRQWKYHIHIYIHISLNHFPILIGIQNVALLRYIPVHFSSAFVLLHTHHINECSYVFETFVHVVRTNATMIGAVLSFVFTTLVFLFFFSYFKVCKHITIYPHNFSLQWCECVWGCVWVGVRGVGVWGVCVCGEEVW